MTVYMDSGLQDILKMELICSPEVLVTSCKTMQCHNPEDHDPHVQ
jgi:hypothetical protein